VAKSTAKRGDERHSLRKNPKKHPLLQPPFSKQMPQAVFFVQKTCRGHLACLFFKSAQMSEFQLKMSVCFLVGKKN
jgi:hypothetical protein